MALRVVAIAVASGRMGYVFLVGTELKDWRMVCKAATAPANAARTTQTWLHKLKPDVVITEHPDTAKAKGSNTQAVIAAVAREAANADTLDMAVPRARVYPNKYAAATALTKRYPELRPWLPHRRCWENEPRQTVLFEALALALHVIRGSVVDLAQAMDKDGEQLRA